MSSVLNKDWKDLIEVDFPGTGPITEETRRVTMEQANRFRGSVRLSLGLFWTDEEYEKLREEELSKPLK